MAAGFNAPISGVFFAVETVLRRQPERLPGEDAADASGLTVAMVLLACVLAAVVSQVCAQFQCSSPLTVLGRILLAALMAK